MELKDYKQLIEERANKLILDTMGGSDWLHVQSPMMLGT